MRIYAGDAYLCRSQPAGDCSLRLWASLAGKLLQKSKLWISLAGTLLHIITFKKTANSISRLSRL
jgi:hypothetical protein